MFYLSAGSISITPENPIDLVGFQGQERLSRSIHLPIEANALLLEKDGGKCLIISLDLLYVGDQLRDRLLVQISERFRQDQVFLSATHTHFAPGTDRTKPKLGNTKDEYLDFIAARLSQLVERLENDVRSPVQLILCEGSAHPGNVSRRKFIWVIGKKGFPVRKMHMVPDLKAPVDNMIRIVKAVDINGCLKAVLWGYSCHPSAFPNMDTITSEFPGVVRRDLRKIDERLPVLFMQGFSGDVRAKLFSSSRNSNRKMSITKVVVRVLQVKEFGTDSLDAWNEWARQLSKAVIALTQEGDYHMLEGPLKASRLSIPVTALGLDSNARLFIHGVSLGPLILVGVSAEVTNHYLGIARQTFRGKEVFPVGCIDNVIGYLPENKMIREGGYEADGFRYYFDVNGDFQRDIERPIRELMEKVMSEIR